MTPFRSRSSVTQSPSPRLARLAIASGIRTARLFPHFEIVDSFRICIYFEYTSESRSMAGRLTHAAACGLTVELRGHRFRACRRAPENALPECARSIIPSSAQTTATRRLSVRPTLTSSAQSLK